MSENIYTAISKIQANPPALLKDGRGQYGPYLTLGNLVDAVTPLLADNDVTLVQIVSAVGQDNPQPGLITRLVHAPSETQIEGTMLLMSAQANPQQQGSAITYARRYALASILGLVADEDDDGETATRAATPRRQTVATGTGNGSVGQPSAANPF